MADVYQAQADPTRLKILDELADRDRQNRATMPMDGGAAAAAAQRR